MNEFFSFFTINLINSSIRLATPIVLAALGAAMCNKAGVLNLAIDGKMLIGAFTGIVATYFFRNFHQCRNELSGCSNVSWCINGYACGRSFWTVLCMDAY